MPVAAGHPAGPEVAAGRPDLRHHLLHLHGLAVTADTGGLRSAEVRAVSGVGRDTGHQATANGGGDDL